jgi:hypothetical protein
MPSVRLARAEAAIGSSIGNSILKNRDGEFFDSPMKK